MQAVRKCDFYLSGVCQVKFISKAQFSNTSKQRNPSFYVRLEPVELENIFWSTTTEPALCQVCVCYLSGVYVTCRECVLPVGCVCYLSGVCVTCQVCVFGALSISQRHQLPQQQWILQDPLNRFDQVRLQRRRVLIGRIPRLQEVLEGCVCFRCITEASVRFVPL